MNNIVLYCKSYRNDVSRAKNLSESIKKYNSDNIPFYISVPQSDLALFKSELGDGVEIISDESIHPKLNGWTGQQVIKSQFWKLNLCKNYVCLDSDTYFIKNFYESDFLYEDDIPYTVCHEDKELMEWSIRSSLQFDIQKSFREDRDKVMELFTRNGAYYDFGPSPTIWSSKVWKSLFDNYIIPNDLTFEQLIKFSPSEFTWYGEWLLKSKVIPIYPKQPICKVFHYREQYDEAKAKGYTEKDFSRNYLGIIMQSNWGAELRYD